MRIAHTRRHPEERVLLVMLDTVELPFAFLGALYAGVVPVVANTLLTAADYMYMLTHSHARARDRVRPHCCRRRAGPGYHRTRRLPC